MNDADGTEPPCDNCYVELDEANVEIWHIYSLVRNQVKVTPMGDVIDLDHCAVLKDIELYVDANKVKKVFESVLECFQIERELAK